jgi:pilus assembly protein CpaE
MTATTTQKPILLLSTDPVTCQAVGEALASNGHFVAGPPCRDLQELQLQLERGPARGVLVDLDPEPERMLPQLEPIIARFQGARFIVISARHDVNCVLAAMQAGARHFLVKSTLAAELPETLNRLIPEHNGNSPGRIYTILGASGGCGATTIAINLANELHLKSAAEVLLIDLDYALGAMGTCLGLDGRYGIADVLADCNRIDPHLISSTSVPGADGLRVLLSPASTHTCAPAPLQTVHLRAALEACKRAFRHVVIDAPHLSPGEALPLALASDLCLVVVQLSVKDIRTAARLLQVLGQGVPRTRLVVLVNRFGCRSMITLGDARRALGDVPVRTIRNDFKAVMRGVNLGQVLAQAAPRCRIRQDLQALFPAEAVGA